MSIVVVGSFVADMVMRVERAPQAGESVMGQSFAMFLGGKGVNQAVAARRLGSEVTMIGCLGADDFGKKFLRTMEDEGISTQYVKKTETVATGCSLVILEANGQNRICMNPGANMCFTAEDLTLAEEVIRQANILVTQCEMQSRIVDELAALSQKYGKRLILNPAPARPLSDETLSAVSVLTPNETELATLVGRELEDDDAYEQAARELLEKGVENVVVTLGSRGSMLVNWEGRTFVPAMEVNAVDTVGAGDSFTGSLATFLEEGMDLLTAMELSTVVAGLQVQGNGAIPSMPTRAQVEQAIPTYQRQ